jgi:hypothetical protein
MTILGVTVVQRYKVDIQYAYKEDETPADKESKTKNENEQLLQYEPSKSAYGRETEALVDATGFLAVLNMERRKDRSIPKFMFNLTNEIGRAHV